MKKVLFLLSVPFLFVACNSNSPEKTAKNFTETVAKGDMDGAKQYMTSGSAALVDMIKSMPSATSMPKYPDYQFEMLRDSIEGDSIAWITYKTPTGEEDELNLVKRDGEWKVTMGGK